MSVYLPLQLRKAYSTDRSCKWCRNHEGPLHAWLTSGGEIVKWECPQCAGQWPFLDFDYFWFSPGRKISYGGAVDKKLGWPFFWRLSDEDFDPHFPAQQSDIYDWGYEGEKPEALAFALLYDFYGWLAWANDTILTPEDNAQRWVEKHCRLFTKQVIAKLPKGKRWKLADADMSKALINIMPESFEYKRPEKRHDD